MAPPQRRAYNAAVCRVAPIAEQRHSDCGLRSRWHGDGSGGPLVQVLKALEAVIDPDFAMNIVDCGFVKDLEVDGGAGRVAFRLELTTPACPIKEEFERDATAVVRALPWVNAVRRRPLRHPVLYLRTTLC